MPKLSPFPINTKFQGTVPKQDEMVGYANLAVNVLNYVLYINVLYLILREHIRQSEAPTELGDTHYLILLFRYFIVNLTGNCQSPYCF